MSQAAMAFISQYRTVLFDAGWRGAIVLALALVVTLLLRRRSASTRHLIWTGAAVVQLVLPLLTLWGPRWVVPVSGRGALVLPTAPLQETLAQHADARRWASAGATRAEPTLATSANGADVASATAIQRNGAELSRATIIAVALSYIWLAGALLVLSRLVLGTIYTAVLARRATRMTHPAWLVAVQVQSAKLGIRRPVKLLRTHALDVPLTWGIAYPVVMLPVDAGEWSAARRNLVLVHELSHIARLDALSQVVAQFALAIFWFNPMLWLANRRMRIERELACDDLVLQHGTKASHYAGELLAMVQRSDESPDRALRPAFAALAMARRTDLEIRLRAILSVDRTRRTAGRAHSLTGVVAAFALVAPIATLDVYQSSVPRCNACEISTPVVATLVQPSKNLHFSVGSQVKRGANGLYYVSHVGNAGQIAMFDANGKYIRSFGGWGLALSKFPAALRFHVVGTADTILVVDQDQNLFVYAPNGDYVRTVHLPVEGWSLIMLPDGRFVAQENIEGNIKDGRSFHLLSSTGKLIRTFGPLLTGNEKFNATAVSRPLSLGKNGEIISAYVDRYRVEQWDTTGRLVRVTEPSTDWFSPSDSKQTHFQMGSAAFDGSVYWTQTGIRRVSSEIELSFKAEMESRGQKFRSPPRLPARRLTRVQAVDPRSGAVIASTDLHDIAIGSMGDSWFYKRYTEGITVPRIEIVHAVLGEATLVRK